MKASSYPIIVDNVWETISHSTHFELLYHQNFNYSYIMYKDVFLPTIVPQIRGISTYAEEISERQ